MNLTGFNDAQQQDLLDLLVLAMYADHHLAVAEDAQVQRLLEAMGFTSTVERQSPFDAAFTRVRPHAEKRAAAQAYARQLARRFTTPEQRQQVCDILTEVLRCDREVSPEETGFLAVIKAEFSS